MNARQAKLPAIEKESPAVTGASSTRSSETIGCSLPASAEPVRPSAMNPAKTMIAAAVPNHSERTLNRDATFSPSAVISVLQSAFRSS